MSVSETRIRASVDLQEPSGEIIEWAKENIDEDSDKRDQIVSEFRDLIFARGECTPHRTDDAFLLRFLRARHFIIRKAHRLMVNYYNFKESNPQFFNDVKIERLRELAGKDFISVPPYKDQFGRRIMILRIGVWDPCDVEVSELFQLIIGIIELAAMQPEIQIKGGVVIFDLSDLSVSQAWYMTPTIANHIKQITMTSFPVRLEAFHILHQSWIFEIGFNFIRPLINENVKDRIIFHGNDLESLHTYINPKHLPKRYGGVHEDYSVDMWFECIKDNDQVIQNLMDLGYEDIQKLKEVQGEGNS